MELLRIEFNRLYKKTDPSFLELRLRNIRYLSELLKFKFCPPTVVFDCLRKCMEEFSGYNINVVAACLECCGRWLYWNQETRLTMAVLMERIIAMKKSKVCDFMDQFGHEESGQVRYFAY